MRSIFLAWAGAWLLLASAAAAGRAQVMYRSGQSVQPVFEGREENPDGSYTMWFGYLNRNHEERPHIPVGPDNYFSVVDAGGAGQERLPARGSSTADSRLTSIRGGRRSSSGSPSRRTSATASSSGR